MLSANAALTRRVTIARLGARESFGSLAVRNYRLYVISQVLTNTFGWAARVAQNWLILTLTGSATLVGLTVLLQFGPMVVFGMAGGVLADRLDRRRLLMVTQTIFGLSTLTVGVLATAGRVEAWHVLAAAFVSGVATAFDNPARQAFVYESAGPEFLRQAISLNSAVFQLGGLVGPAVAGVLIEAVGEGWAFLLNAAAALVAVVLLVAMRPDELTPAPAVPRAKGQLREGLRYVRRTPRILWPVVLIGFVAVTGLNMATVLAAYADTVFVGGAGGYALLNSMLALGALAGALLSTRRQRLRLRHLVVLTALVGVAEVVLAALTQHTAFVVVLVALGTLQLLYITGGNTLVQETVADELRGRVMALYVLVSLGGQGLSGLIVGWVSEHVGAHVAMAVCAAGPLLGTVVVGIGIARTVGMRPRDAATRVLERVQTVRRSSWPSPSAGARTTSAGSAIDGATSSSPLDVPVETVPCASSSPLDVPVAVPVETVPCASSSPPAVPVPVPVETAPRASSYAGVPDVPEPRRTSATPATTSAAPTS